MRTHNGSIEGSCELRCPRTVELPGLEMTTSLHLGRGQADLAYLLRVN